MADITQIRRYVHVQSEFDMEWDVTHNLGVFPDVSVYGEDNRYIPWCGWSHITKDRLVVYLRVAATGRCVVTA